jgi:hypothetical protein
MQHGIEGEDVGGGVMERLDALDDDRADGVADLVCVLSGIWVWDRSRGLAQGCLELFFGPLHGFPELGRIFTLAVEMEVECATVNETPPHADTPGYKVGGDEAGAESSNVAWVVLG